MIDRDMTAPFMATVKTGRSAKADKGEAVEVHCFSKKWDSARCKRGDGEFVWLSFKNLENTGPASDEVVAALAAERAAFKAKSEAPVVVGTEPAWESDRCVAFDFQVEGIRTRQRMFIPRFFKDGRTLWDATTGTIPQWMWDIKSKEGAFAAGRLTPV